MIIAVLFLLSGLGVGYYVGFTRGSQRVVVPEDFDKIESESGH